MFFKTIIHCDIFNINLSYILKLILKIIFKQKKNLNKTMNSKTNNLTLIFECVTFDKDPLLSETNHFKYF